MKCKGISLFTYDNGNRRATLKIPLSMNNKYVTTTYGYDTANRLLSALLQGPSAQIENLIYTYDQNGNRTSFTRNAPQTLSPEMSNTSHDEANQMLAFNSKTLTYDNNGNLLTKVDSCGTTTYTWDARNRLTGISGYKPDCTTLSASFSYDALGRRISKTINGTTTQFIYDGWDITQEIKAGVKTNYIRTLNIDEPLTRVTGSTVRHYVTDALGSVMALTDDSGAVKTTYVYDPFGNVTITGETSDNAFQYTGRENDGTGLYYYRARYYSPEMQRFISADPIRMAGGMNFYEFVNGSPPNYIDAFGLWPSWTLQIGSGGTAGAGGGVTATSGIVIGYSDEHGLQFGFYEVQGGGGHGGISLGATYELLFSKNKNICDLAGVAGTIGGSYSIVSPVLSLGPEINVMKDVSPSYGFTIGLSPPLPYLTPIEEHGYVTKTWVQKIWSSK